MPPVGGVGGASSSLKKSFQGFNSSFNRVGSELVLIQPLLTSNRKIKNFERETDNTSTRKRITAEEAAVYALNQSQGRDT